MSRQLINEYRAELDRLRAVSGSRRESVLREAFKDLLKRWGKAAGLQFVAEHDILTKAMTRIYVDGALLHGLRVPFGYWEAKDENDDLAAEIAAKFRKGYPRDNIVFTDDRVAVLWQDGAEAARADMQADDESLLQLLTRFFAHERAEIADFNKAVRQFATDLPHILTALRERIAEKHAASRDFADALTGFLQHARDAINPAVSEDDVREMLIQHILTEDIFAKVFNDPDFHRKNNVAAELQKLEDRLFARGEKAGLLRALDPYYAGIASTAALIQSHSEKQGFLKALYEDFYKAYNRKAADRLGVVYTPGEIVRFMIRSADWLCERHFGKCLIDRGVEILDPATGTGTFIVELLEHFRGNHDKLRHKYKEELHANEVAILPYYVANLNIEATYQAITGQFAEFENLCLVDTLDNVDALGIHSGHQFDMLGSLSDENIERIKRQNRRKISVIIGNPPYNANQQNENDNNKNRTYAHIDKRIKDTYIKASTAQKTKLYDMYARFYRWASDRLGNEGVLAFVTNRSFIDSRTFDGFRKNIAADFSDIWIVDLGGDYKEAGPAGKANVFGIGTGVALALLVRRPGHRSVAHIAYLASPDTDAEGKLSWLHDLDLGRALPTTVRAGPDGSWLDEANDFPANFLPVATKRAKIGERNQGSVFKLFSLGVVTNRDEWVYDLSPKYLSDKVAALLSDYASAIANPLAWAPVDADEERFQSGVKWTRALKGLARKRAPIDTPKARLAYYRPFSKMWLSYSPQLNEMPYLNDQIFPFTAPWDNQSICFTGPDSQKPWMLLATAIVPDLHLVGSGAGTVELPRYRYTKSGERVDNITDWALARFREHYAPPRDGEGDRDAKRRGGGAADPGDPLVADAPPPPLRGGPPPQHAGEDQLITKDSIFHYVYAVLHDPVYRETYALNLKREFPRIPFYPDFAQWAAWGEALMAMHIGYEAVEPWPVERIDTPNPRRAEGTHPKPILKSVPEQGLVRVDEDTQITGIPRAAWDYRLGNRAAIDWVLDQHKEKTPRDPTIREKFNTYRLADYKESMIALLAKVARVSVETVAITTAMAAVPDRDG